MFEDSSLGLKLKRIKENKIEISYHDVNIKIKRGEYQHKCIGKIPMYLYLYIRNQKNLGISKWWHLGSCCIEYSHTVVPSAQEELKWIIHQAEIHGYHYSSIMKLWRNLKKKKKIRRLNTTENTQAENDNDKILYIMESNPFLLKHKIKIERAVGRRITFRRNTNTMRNDKDKRNP